MSRTIHLLLAFVFIQLLPACTASETAVPTAAPAPLPAADIEGKWMSEQGASKS